MISQTLILIKIQIKSVLNHFINYYVNVFDFQIPYGYNKILTEFCSLWSREQDHLSFFLAHKVSSFTLLIRTVLSNL